jgi:hypothetical protein
MNWRRVLPVLLSLLLPLPLLWLISIALSGTSAQVPLPQGKTLVPMLSPEERLRLSTYERDCRTDTDCESQLRCFYDMRTARQYCTDSRCTEDEHCSEGFTCLPLEATNDKELVRVCSLLGVRKEGELCERLPSARGAGCAKGLFCQGFCGRPCRMNESSCPEGFFCHEGSNGLSCLPTCKGHSCPEGQRCVPLAGEGASVCMTVHGEDCERPPCPEGLRCTRNAYPDAPDEIWMECLRSCGESEPPCPEGAVCTLYQCRKTCEPQDSSVCGEGFRCGSNHPDMPWACVPGTSSTKGN